MQIWIKNSTKCRFSYRCSKTYSSSPFQKIYFGIPHFLRSSQALFFIQSYKKTKLHIKIISEYEILSSYKSVDYSGDISSTLILFLHHLFASYMRISALFVRLSGVSPPLNSTTPPDTVNPPSSSSLFLIRSAHLSAAHESESGSTMKNSSPQSRYALSIPRSIDFITIPNFRSASSPASCPSVSFIRLKWSISNMIADNFRPRNARAISSLISRSNAVRFHNFVRVSVFAISSSSRLFVVSSLCKSSSSCQRTRSSSFIRLCSVISCRTHTNFVTHPRTSTNGTIVVLVQYNDPSLRRLQISPTHVSPVLTVRQRFRQNSLG